MRISSKLRVVVIIPLLAVLGFAALALTVAFGNVNEAERVSALVTAATRAEDLAHQMQAERTLALTLLVGGASDGVAEYVRQTETTDSMVAAYRSARQGLQPESDLLTTVQAGLVAAIDQDLDGLGALRNQVQSGTATSLSAVSLQYRIIVADLIALISGVAQGGSSSDVSDLVRAGAELARAAEHVGLEQVAVARVVAMGQLNAVDKEAVTAARVGYTEALTSFAALAPPEWVNWLNVALAGPEILAAQRLQDRVARAAIGESVDVDLAEWMAATTVRMQRLHDVYQRVAEVVTADVSRLLATEKAWAIGETAGVVLAVVAAVLLALWLATPMLRGLRRLAEASQLVARDHLPAAVERLRVEETLGDRTPAAFAEQVELPTLPAGRDEIAEVAGAFTAVYRSALRLAAEQAVERRSVGAIFVNLARRGDRMLGRLTSQLDRVEQDEQDPVRLDQLFRIDNQIAVLRRTNRTLLTLGGKGSGRVPEADVALGQVLRGAQSQVERYQQIVLSHVDAGVAIARDAVDGVVHLLAELLDNATAYSHPDARVMVTARLLVDRALIEVTDQGIGLDAARLAELNRRLAAPPVLDVDATRAMGLTAVAQIASNLGITVRLHSRSGVGTTAEITIPSTILRPDRDNVASYQGVEPPASSRRRPSTLDGPRHAAVDAPAAHYRAIPSTHAAVLDRTEAPVGHAPRQASAPASPADQVDATEPPIFKEVWQRGWFSAGGLAQWTSPADSGWHAASASAAAAPEGPEHAHPTLPRRRPMAQLVPGAVPGDTIQIERDIAATAASMAAFARGVGARRADSTRSHSVPTR